LLELVGAKSATPREIDGISFAPTLFGKKQKERPFLYRESPGYGGQQCVRVGEWKVIRQNLNPSAQQKDLKPGAVELYNLAKDPFETTNLATKYPEIVRKLERIMRLQHTRSVLWPIKALDGNASKP